MSGRPKYRLTQGRPRDRVSTNQIFATQSDPQNLQRRMVLDLARVISDGVAFADKQTADTRQLFDIPDAVGVLVFLNESATALPLDVIHWTLAHEFGKRCDSGALRYTANDCVILISGANSFAVRELPCAFPMLSFISPSKRQPAFISEFSDKMRRQWYAFNNA
jgi:hypothetical protein